MMNWVFGIIILVSIIIGISTGEADKLSNSILEEGSNAIQLSLYLMGGMCVWGGIMRIADKAGLTSYMCKLFKPFGKFIFKGLDLNGKAFKAISMNIAANMLGLGNAATPFGLEAMKEIEKEDGENEYASNNMVSFVVLNTASITLIPTTAAMMRYKYGSDTPFDILPAVLINSVIALTVALTLSRFIGRHSQKKK